MTLDAVTLSKIFQYATAVGVNMYIDYQARVEKGELTPEEVEAEVDNMIAEQLEVKAELDASIERALAQSD
jgi:polyhydroxyalkanoate synthesis regulator phasin